jgi:hypothetical protein
MLFHKSKNGGEAIHLRDKTAGCSECFETPSGDGEGEVVLLDEDGISAL